MHHSAGECRAFEAAGISGIGVRGTTMGTMTLQRLLIVVIVAVLLVLAATLVASIWGMNIDL